MFGKRIGDEGVQRRAVAPIQPAPPQKGTPASAAPAHAPPVKSGPVAEPPTAVAAREALGGGSTERRHSEEYYDVKTTVFNALIDTIDLTQLAKLDAEAAREEIRDIVAEIIQIKNVVMSIAEQEELLEDIC
ncbi:MAG: CpaF family protein, partial [Hyphomicrobiaceae bacterium]